MDGRSERGESLVEILVALVVMGIVVAGLFAAITTTATASKTHNNFVTADAVLRDYAELTKRAAVAQCTGTAAPLVVSYTPPANSGISVSATGLTCPATVTAVRQVDITATLPDNKTKKLSIDVGTP